MYIDTMQQVYSNVTKVFVDSRNNQNLLYLPIDKLMQLSGAAPAAATTAAPATAAPDTNVPSGGAVDVRSRDNQRTRDRDGR